MSARQRLVLAIGIAAAIAIGVLVPLAVKASGDSWAEGYVVTLHNQLMTGATVCIKEESGRTSCTRTSDGHWQLVGLNAGNARITEICLPAERDTLQLVRSIVLPAGRYYDGLRATTCVAAGAAVAPSRSPLPPPASQPTQLASTGAHA